VSASPTPAVVRQRALNERRLLQRLERQLARKRASGHRVSKEQVAQVDALRAKARPE
jgi:hypothetical protein